MNGSGGLPGSEERKRTKIRSAVRYLPKNEKTKIRSDGLRTNRGTKIRSGRFRTNGRTKIRSGGLLKNENPKIKICKIGRLPKNENPKIKIRLVGFRVLKNNGKPRFVSGSLEKVEPRFVNTNLGLVSWVGSDEQKKTKDL
ncbi:unnamed protein product [Rhizophagus irregularis]|nr:unnamed protein product [Rhizophagus irregularis]